MANFRGQKSKGVVTTNVPFTRWVEHIVKAEFKVVSIFQGG